MAINKQRCDAEAVLTAGC